MSDEARFMYLRHPACKQSVLTIARVLEDDTITFAWALNRHKLVHPDEDDIDPRLREIMTRSEFIALRKKWRTKRPYDVWDKRVGRSIALGRLATDCAISIPYEKGNVARRVLEKVLDTAKRGTTAGEIAWLTLDHWSLHHPTA